MSNKTNTQTMVGFFGGAFDPVHLGHLKNAALVKRQLNLSKLYLMPYKAAVHKNKAYFDENQRLKMLMLGIQEFPELSIDTRELENHTPCYTIDTLIQIKKQYPNTPIGLIMGMDNFMQLDTWKKSQELKNYAHLIVLARKYQSRRIPMHEFQPTDNIKILHTQASGLLYFNHNQLIDISSSTIRSKIRHQQSLSGLLPKSVIDYIKKNESY